MSTEGLVAALDVLALAGFSAATVAVALMPMGGIDVAQARAIRGLLVAALGICAFAAFSNVLEHGGVTAALDPYEDYIEILVFPLIAYAMHQTRFAVEMAAAARAEERLSREHALLSATMTASPVGAMVVDEDGRITFANPAAVELLDLDEREDGTFEPKRPLMCAEQVRSSHRFDLVRFGTGEMVRGALCPIETSRGQIIVSVTSAPLEAPSSAGGSTLVLVLDVTERERARQEAMDAQVRYAEALERAVDGRTAELLKANAELKRANQAQQRLLANVSHELRTPLNAVIGFTDVISSGLAGPLTEEQLWQLGMVKEASHQLLMLVDTLLEAQRLEVGEAAVSFEPRDVARVLRASAEMLAPLAANKEVALEVRAPESLEARTDADLLTQVVRNLLSNAIKFTPSGGRVTATLHDAGDRFRVIVSDTGIGIPPEALESIFDAFVQVRQPDGRKPEGTGLGLAICKQIVETLGGAIAVDSEPGAGSTFTVELPVDGPGGDGITRPA